MSTSVFFSFTILLQKVTKQMVKTFTGKQIFLYMLCYAKSLQSCPTLCDPIDGSPPGSPVPGILQARTWSGLPFPSPMHESESEREVLSRVRLLATPWTAAYQAPPSMGFSRQEYWSGVPLPSSGEVTSSLLMKERNVSTIREWHEAPHPQDVF